MTLKAIENKIAKLLRKEILITSEEFSVTFLGDGSFNISLFTEEDQNKDMETMKMIAKYLKNLNAVIVNDIEAYICEIDGYLGTYYNVKI
tara:strand:- start:539 stop:808 length:270 start_codon:yes stop_codon:yes gene_type:complete